MIFPEKILIERIEDYHTHYLGHNDKGKKFWAYPTFFWSIPYKDIVGDWKDFRKEYTIMHIFDSDGTHLKTNYWYAGSTNQVKAHELYNKIEEMVKELGKVTFCDIEVKLFSTLIDDVEFGLIPNPEFKCIDLQPSSTIAFTEPWDGSYST